MSNDLSKLFAAQLDKTSDKKKPPEKKKKPPNKPKPEKKEITVQDISNQLDDTFGDDEYDDPDLGSLIGESQKAKLEQEISKAKSMKYKADQDLMKLKILAGKYMEFKKGDLLFFGFIDKCSLEILRVMDKLEPTIKNLVAEGDDQSIRLLVNKELENILIDIQEEQNEAVDKWRKELK